ncbi:MAG: dTDP-glucose pyrophosphorylase [Myxococcota bacterium]|jgi:dTDP-glucose pyrophosphorylase
MSDATLVLCMAGLYRRFREAGYTTPKYLLPVRGEPILAWIVRELAPRRLVLVANRRDQGHEQAIRSALALGGVPGADLHFVGDTSGQAETAAIGARRALALGFDGPMAFHNVDTVLLGRDLAAIGAVLGLAQGYIDVFDNDSPAYSYVAVDGDRVTRIVEKQVISRHATTGLYGFRSPAYYLARQAATAHRSRGEFYVSDVYKAMLEDGEQIQVGRGAGGAVVLGTPAEYEAYVAESGR